jgi:transcriptional regulator with XRE-family HTH domain
MGDVFYWGEGGQYGPYHAQEDGWPNGGEVVRDFRERRGLSASDFAEQYSKELHKLGKQNRKGKSGAVGRISGTWILNMEKQNRVPTDIERRRIIARLLDIPPVLLGLAMLQDMVLQPQKETHMQPAAPPMLKKISTDIARYEKNVRVALHIHRTSSAQGLLHDIDAELKDLKSLESQAKGDFLYQVRELILSNNLLATRIMKDAREYAVAYAYANDAVRVAKSTQDGDLIATARYMRGCAKAEWGRRGIIQQGMFQLDQDKIKDAILDFQKILAYAHSKQGRIHPQLEGFTKLQLSRALGMLKTEPRNSRITQALTMSDEVADAVGIDPIDDFYTRALVTGTLSGLHMGGYHLGRAEIFNAVGLPGKALHELNHVKKLTEGTYGGDETRYQAWFDVLMAESLIGLKDYYEATSRAKRALIIFHNIRSLRNIASIKDIYSRIAASSYGTSEDVKELADMLKEWYETEPFR